jgi:hypothetical protein
MSRVGFVMLCHTALDRAAQVARHWAGSGCPVVIHVDRRVPRAGHAAFRAALEGLPQIRYAPRHRCEWGTWGIVAATVAATRLMLSEFPGVRHVYLASGSCLPLRPVQELQAYLDAKPDTDFIESVTTADVTWTVGGLDSERFTLRFPFAWKRQRWLFDRAVALQRRLGLRRRIPAGLVPHLGSQWWCLTRRTLEAIFADPRLPEWDRYFRHVWIPDESYFQTLVRLHATRIESRSLTLSKFDFQGKPHIFYDDHLQLLRRSDCFMARKIWPRADKLYASFLSNDPQVANNAEPNPGKIDKLFSKAVERRTRGRPGLRMQSRFPNEGWENGVTAAPYSVFEGFSELFEGFELWLEKTLGGRVHGHLFAPDRVEFAGGERTYNGALSDSAAIRDYDPEGFLIRLIWNTRGERQCFQFGPADRQEIGWFLARDRNAQISVVTGAWAVPLFRSRRDFADVRATAARLQAVEAKHLEILRSPHARARVRIWSLAEFVEAPMEPLQVLLDEIAPRNARRLTEAPRIADLSGFAAFLQRLRNEGMNPWLLGDFPNDPDPAVLAGVARRRSAAGQR